MNYPRPIMSIPELNKEVGLPLKYLRNAVHSRWADKFATHGKNNSKWQIDTEEFEKLRKRGIL